VSVAAARAFLQRNGLAPHRDRGQNFLHDDALAEKLVRVAGVGEGDSVVEVGTGLGILTRALAARAEQVVSVEIDAGLVRALRAEQVLPERVRLIHADALQIDWEPLLRELPAPVRIVANLPYSAATPLLRKFLDLAPHLRGWAVMVQKELAVRLRAAPGSRGFGSFSVLHRLVADVQESLEVHPRCFYPVPRVTSTFLRLAPLSAKPLAPGELAAVEPLAPGELAAVEPLAPGELAGVERVVRAAFAHRRKTLANSLGREGVLAPARVQQALREEGLDARSRAENLTPGAWLKLTRKLPIPQKS